MGRGHDNELGGGEGVGGTGGDGGLGGEELGGGGEVPGGKEFGGQGEVKVMVYPRMHWQTASVKQVMSYQNLLMIAYP